MQAVEPKHRKNQAESHIYIRLPTGKPQKTPYCNSHFFLPGVAEHRIAKSPGLKGCGAFLFFFMSVQICRAFFNTHNVTCRFALFLTQLFPYIFSLHLHSNEPRQLSIANLFSCSVYLYRLVVDTFSYQGILNEKNILRDNQLAHNFSTLRQIFLQYQQQRSSSVEQFHL